MALTGPTERPDATENLTVALPDPLAPTVKSDVQAAEYLGECCHQLQHELSKVIVGQDRVIEEILIAIFARGHCLVQGVPGLAKTLLVSSLSRAMDLSFRRIQFTPDLMPSDITGTDILQEDPDTGRRRFEFLKGPLFANMLLADEINRTPPKTQAALLQAMQEQQVTVGSQTMDLPKPFFVLATQNPIEQEGTYPLPEAQLDRFMFMVVIQYPRREHELEVLKRTTGDAPAGIRQVIDACAISKLQEIVRRVPVGDHVYSFALDLVRATRPNEPGASDFVRHWLSWGAGPRAGQYLILAGKARALIRGRLHVTVEDIEAVAAPALRHRLVPNFNADAEGVTVEQIIEKVITLIPRGKGERLLRTHVRKADFLGDTTLKTPKMQKQKTGVLTIIGISKILEAAFLFLVVLETHRLLHRNVADTVREWAKEAHLDPDGKYLRGMLASLLSVDAKKLKEFGVVAFIYFALHLSEGIGLLLHKRWAEYFTVISTSLLVPLEVYEICHKPSTTKVIVLLINLAIVAYLIYRLIKTREEPGALRRETTTEQDR